MIKTKYPVVKIGTPEYDAWVEFFSSNKLKRFFPQTMTVHSEWPPTTREHLALFVDWFAGIRADLEAVDDMDYMNAKKRHKESMARVNPFYRFPNRNKGAA